MVRNVVYFIFGMYYLMTSKGHENIHNSSYSHLTALVVDGSHYCGKTRLACNVKFNFLI